MAAIDDMMPAQGTPPRRTSEEDLEGFDESQRAEVVETLGGVQNDGDLQTDIKRDNGDDPYSVDDDADELETIVSTDGAPDQNIDDRR